jgi:hypothetical protein
MGQMRHVRHTIRLDEVFRLKHVQRTNFSAAVAMPYVGDWTALATVIILLVYKIAVIGW